MDLQLEPETFSGLIDFQDYRGEWFDWAKKKHADPNFGIVAKTGLVDLDDVFTLREQELTVLAGRPGMGKSAMAGTIALNCVQKPGPLVAYFSMEMARKAMTDRWVAAAGRVDLRKALATMDDTAKYRLDKAWATIPKGRLFLDDRGGMSPAKIREELERVHGVKLIVCDYLGLMGDDNEKSEEKLYLRIGKNMKALRLIARDFGAAMIVLCQLNRNAAGRTDKLPVLSDLRDSGNIEEDADNVIFLHREIDKQTGQDSTTTEVIVAKQRNGMVGKVQVYWDKEFTSFRDLSDVRKWQS